MDPNACLDEILDLVQDISDDEDSSDDAQELASKVLILHEWIARGGFLPKKWAKK